MRGEASIETLERDSLTGLRDAQSARATLTDWGVQYAARGASAPIQAMLIGLARFDTVNLAYGDAAGDGALIEVARRIVHFAADELESGTWIAARMGGGTFLLAALEPCSRERWQLLADTLADAVALPISGVDEAGALRLWPRIALVRAAGGEGVDTLLDRLAQTFAAGQARHGRRILWADEADQPAGRRAADLEADLLGALDNDEIEVLYQPQFALAHGRMVGAEALARWQHPELGRIGANALFAIAERADHVAHLSRHIAARALAGARDWPDTVRLSLNVTPTDLAAGNFARSFVQLVEESGFPAARVTVEITEQVLLADLERAAAALAVLRETGMRTALDDFGAGFCNFRYLKLLPLDYLKLDRTMVEGIADDPRDLAVLRAILAMARALNLEVIAEGIETSVQRDVIAAEGCAVFQGYLGGTPMSGAELTASWL